MPSNPDSVSALLDHSEALYFSGKLREAIALLERALGSASVKDFISVELQLGKLLVATIFMEGASPQPARVHLQGALTGGDPRQRATATDLLGLSCYYEQLGRERSTPWPAVISKPRSPPARSGELCASSASRNFTSASSINSPDTAKKR
jgi:hypothetical protein